MSKYAINAKRFNISVKEAKEAGPMVELFYEIPEGQSTSYADLIVRYEELGFGKMSAGQGKGSDNKAAVRKLLQGWNRAYYKDCLQSSSVPVKKCSKKCCMSKPHRICSTSSKPASFWMLKSTYDEVYKHTRLQAVDTRTPSPIKKRETFYENVYSLEQAFKRSSEADDTFFAMPTNTKHSGLQKIFDAPCRDDPHWQRYLSRIQDQKQM